MKKLLIVISLASATVFAACHNKAKEEAATEQAFKRIRVEKAVRDSLKLDSFKKADSAEKAQLAGPKDQPALATQNTGSATKSTYSGQTQAQHKKGWSSAAKGAVIGGAGGAVGGAIISRNKGKGAAIGAVVGAGTGYIIGRSHDRKTGRVHRHKPKHKSQ